MSSDAITLEVLHKKIAEFERQTGRVPATRELAEVLHMSSAELRNLLEKLLSDEKSDGSSVFKTNLRDILLNPHWQQHSAGIPHKEVHLVDEDGAHLGIVPTLKALQTAQEKGLGLFLVKPDANPPVAQLANYDKFVDEQEKKETTDTKRHSFPALREVTMPYDIPDHDYLATLQKTMELLKDGNKVRVTVAPRSQELQHTDLAINLLTRLAADLSEIAVAEEEPCIQGMTAVMTLWHI